MTRALLLIAEHVGGPGLLNVVRRESATTTHVHVLVPVAEGVHAYFMPFEVRGWLPEDHRALEHTANRARAKRRLSELQWLMWEMGFTASGGVVDSGLETVVLRTWECLNPPIVVVSACGSPASRCSAKGLARRLKGRVPVSLVSD